MNFVNFKDIGLFSLAIFFSPGVMDALISVGDSSVGGDLGERVRSGFSHNTGARQRLTTNTRASKTECMRVCGYLFRLISIAASTCARITTEIPTKTKIRDLLQSPYTRRLIKESGEI